jgi:hypothetical protein
MTWVACHLQQRLRTGVKQQVEDHLLVLQSHWRQSTRQGEYRVDVASGQEFPFPRREPAQAGVALAPRTMPVATRNGVLSITCVMGSFLLWGVRR